jgi:hypothetical protein
LRISYQNEKDVIVQVSKFLQITGIINRTLKPSQVEKHTRLKINDTLALPALLCGCDTWAVREQDKSVDMRFMGRMAKYTWQDYITLPIKIFY